MLAFHKEVHAVNGSEEDMEADHKTMYPKANGPLFSLEMLVDTPQAGRLISIHHPGELPDLINEPIEIYPGNTYNILVTPSVTAIEDDVKKMNPYRKNCVSHLFDQELTIFRKYSKSGCMLECKLRRAAKRCGCIPWDYPKLDEGAPICHFQTTTCFKTEMSKGVTPTECSCLNDCDLVSYTYDIIVKSTQVNDYCYGSEGLWQEHVAPWQGRNNFLGLAAEAFSKSYRELIGLETSSQENLCEATLRGGIAAVKIYIGPPAADVSTRSLRVTFADRVANIGEI